MKNNKSAFVIDGSRKQSVGQQLAIGSGRKAKPVKGEPLIKKMWREIFRVYTMRVQP